ncbi:hypothetical protein GF407_07490 [candidate division KSB1 bacterium]|nr:hypothetical protein [candidate division KSB1 bacterium]
MMKQSMGMKMQTLNALEKKLDSTKDLQSVVKTMKAIAAVSIRQYNLAVESLKFYNRTIDMSFSVLLRHSPEFYEQPQSEKNAPSGFVILGSDQGMCGQFNEDLATFIKNTTGELNLDSDNCTALVLGQKIVPYINDLDIKIEEQLWLPGALNGISNSTIEVLFKISEWHKDENIQNIYLFYNLSKSGASYEPHYFKLLPLDKQKIENLKHFEWRSTSIPIFKVGRQTLLANLLRQYFFVSVYRAFAESLASENLSRLASMQAAEKNIDERLQDLENNYNRQRQSSITSELLDLVSGYEVLSQ